MLQVGVGALGNTNTGSASHLHSSLLRTAHLSELGKAGSPVKQHDTACSGVSPGNSMQVTTLEHNMAASMFKALRQRVFLTEEETDPESGSNLLTVTSEQVTASGLTGNSIF